jgi:hypothetical protein
MVSGVAILLTSIGISYLAFGQIWPAFGYPIPTIIVEGPLSLDEYEVLQRHLENQALLDNLSISPIGDLWVSPWG